MKARLLTAVIGFAVLAPIVIFSHTIVLPIAVALFSALGVWEMLSCIGFKKNPEILIPSFLLAVVVPLIARLVIAEKGIAYFMTLMTGAMFVYFYYMLALAVVSKGKKPIGEMALACLMTLYIIFGFNSILVLRDFPSGFYYFVIVFAAPWVSDAAGYFVGRALGKHKLIPDVSPKKTVEGAVGGVVFCAVCMVVVGLIAQFASGLTPNYIGLAIAGLFLAVISIFGDLIASLIKRHYEIKDYGNLFPGHGGVMDRFDSIIATAPFVLILCSHPEIFTLFTV